MTSPFENFEDLVLLSPSEMKRELCELIISISHRIVLYKILVVGKNGKFYDTIEVSALWSTAICPIDRPYTSSLESAFVC